LPGSTVVNAVEMFTGLVEDTGVVVAADVTGPGDLAVGDRVNLEADILAKHVEKLVKP
jgi:riboflavin synthase alpha subunit